MEQDLTQLSRTMSYALRHNPASFGLTLDEEGWVAVEDLLTALRRRKNVWRTLREDDLTLVITQSEKHRFEIRDSRIRAYYGHSIADKITREPTIPPIVLFHGTTPQAARKIITEGLKPMNRQYVHLSADEETARTVALRRTQHPVILQVAALQAYEQGIPFFLGNDMVWLACPVPPDFITTKQHDTI